MLYHVFRSFMLTLYWYPRSFLRSSTIPVPKLYFRPTTSFTCSLISNSIPIPYHVWWTRFPYSVPLSLPCSLNCILTHPYPVPCMMNPFSLSWPPCLWFPCFPYPSCITFHSCSRNLYPLFIPSFHLLFVAGTKETWTWRPLWMKWVWRPAAGAEYRGEHFFRWSNPGTHGRLLQENYICRGIQIE